MNLWKKTLTPLSRNKMLKIFILIFLSLFSFTGSAQKSKKYKGEFCGVHMKTAEMIRKIYSEQIAFVSLQENDTIVDIGAASGWFEGALSSVTDFRNISFVLVDIDSGCLNQLKVDRMQAHYASVKGAPITNRFIPVLNTPDSLYLPLDLFPKVWLLNTLHELPDKKKMILDIHAVLRNGGEVLVLEMEAEKINELHPVCRKPLLSFEELRHLFQANGFIYKDHLRLSKKRNDLVFLRFVKN